VKMRLRVTRLNPAIGVLLIIANCLFFIPATIVISINEGGAWGVGLLILPITLAGNLYLIPAILSMRKKYQSRKSILYLNLTGLFGSVFWIVLYFINRF